MDHGLVGRAERSVGEFAVGDDGQNVSKVVGNLVLFVAQGAGGCPANFGNFAVHAPNNFCDVFFVVADEFADFGIGVVEVGVET